MCIHCTYLNITCFKDLFPQSNNNKVVDNSSGYKFLLFMDAYLRFHFSQVHVQRTFMTFPGLHVDHKGIEANPEKCKIVQEMFNILF